MVLMLCIYVDRKPAQSMSYLRCIILLFFFFFCFTVDGNVCIGAEIHKELLIHTCVLSVESLKKSRFALFKAY